MAFTPKMPEAARRNLQAAEQLDAGSRRDVAGYLYGLAAECAIKEMIKPIPVPLEHDKNAIFYAHFPKLRTLLRDAFVGRRMKPVWNVILNNAFMHNWDVAMRYADARQIPDEWVNDWKQQAKDIVGAIGT
jgi:hypothetical protein